MAWFGVIPSKRDRVEQSELKKKKRTMKYASEAAERDKKIGLLQDKTRLLKAEQAYKKAKKGGKSSSQPLFEVSIGKKKQGKKISRKSRIRLI
jgi:uncharacterized small protein (DUF1192 family)